MSRPERLTHTRLVRPGNTVVPRGRAVTRPQAATAQQLGIPRSSPGSTSPDDVVALGAEGELTGLL